MQPAFASCPSRFFQNVRILICNPDVHRRRVVPLRFCSGRDEAHRSLGERSDGEAGVDTKIGRDHRAIADVHVAVAKDAVLGVNDAMIRGIGDHTTADAVGRAWDVEQNFGKHAHGEASREFGELLGKLVGFRDVRWDLIATTDQEFAERPEPGTLPLHFNLVIQRLHAQQYDKFTRPSPGLQHAQRLERVAEEGVGDILQPKANPSRPGTPIGQKPEPMAMP
jgi:hypothetical protein